MKEIRCPQGHHAHHILTLSLQPLTLTASYGSGVEARAIDSHLIKDETVGDVSQEGSARSPSPLRCCLGQVTSPPSPPKTSLRLGLPSPVLYMQGAFKFAAVKDGVHSVCIVTDAITAPTVRSLRACSSLPPCLGPHPLIHFDTENMLCRSWAWTSSTASRTGTTRS